MRCIPDSVASNLPKAMPDPLPNEYASISITDHTGKTLLKPLIKQVKNFYEITKTQNGFILAYRDVLRNVLLNNAPVQWDKNVLDMKKPKMEFGYILRMVHENFVTF